MLKYQNVHRKILIYIYININIATICKNGYAIEYSIWHAVCWRPHIIAPIICWSIGNRRGLLFQRGNVYYKYRYLIQFKLYRFQVQLWHIGIVVRDGPLANTLLFERGCKCSTVITDASVSCKSRNERSRDWSLFGTDRVQLQEEKKNKQKTFARGHGSTLRRSFHEPSCLQVTAKPSDVAPSPTCP